jgi:O-antigen/teichoic acid export membrane protein
MARGGGVVFIASLLDRMLRLVVTWVLSTALGPAAFGSYTFAVAVVTLTSIFATLGTEVGAIYFGARYRRAKDLSKLKGLLISGTILTTISGLSASIGLYGFAPWLFDDPEPVRWIAPAVAFWAPLYYVVGLLRAVKDMRSNALVYQLGLSSFLAVGALIIWGVTPSVQLALSFYIVALALALPLGWFRAWRHYGSLLKDVSIKPEFHLGELLRYSLPQALSSMVAQMNLWMDILMMGYLTSDSEIGTYKIVAALVAISGMPITALITIFNPIIAEKVEAKELSELNLLLKRVTRWVVTGSMPLLMLLYLLPKWGLSLFDDAYLGGALILQVLVLGRFVMMSCSMSMRLIPMSGHAMLNLINGIVAVMLNITLNWTLIPLYGGLGAAIATSITIALWSLWRVIEVWYLLRCFPFSLSSGLFLLASLLSTLLLYPLLEAQPEPIRVLSSLLLAGAFVLASLKWGMDAEDHALLNPIKKKWRQMSRSS